VPNHSRRKVLKKEVDLNRDVGVWQQTTTPAAELLRWHYSGHDPRAHSSDALPHDQRRLEVVLFVDLSILPTERALQQSAKPSRTMVDGRSSMAAARATSSSSSPSPAPAPSLSLLSANALTLLPRRTSELLEKMGFRVVAEPSFTSAMSALLDWSPAYQWTRYQEGQMAHPSQEGSRLPTERSPATESMGYSVNAASAAAGSRG